MLKILASAGVAVISEIDRDLLDIGVTLQDAFERKLSAGPRLLDSSVRVA
jgi:hypothetical protein